MMAGGDIETIQTMRGACEEAGRLLNCDPSLDRVMILPAESALGLVSPKMEGKTARIRCFEMIDGWYILTRDGKYPSELVTEASFGGARP